MASLEQLRKALGDPSAPETAEAAEAVGTLRPLVPPDPKQCQAMKPGNGPFVMGGRIGDPRDGYRLRCEAVPTVIAEQTVPGSDGRMGSMALCDECLAVSQQPLFARMLGPMKYTKINQPKEDT